MDPVAAASLKPHRPRPHRAPASLATCSLDRRVRRGRVTRRNEQPLGGARVPRPLARFSLAAAGSSLEAACSSQARALVKRRATPVVSRGARARMPWTPPPRSVSARAHQRGGGGEPRGRASDVQSLPFPRPTGAHARPSTARRPVRDPHSARGAGGGDADVAPPMPHRCKRQIRS